MDNEWKNSLRERFSDYSVPEPEGLWEGIDQGIAGKPRRKMLPVWLVSGAAAAAAVALGIFLHPEKAREMPDLQKQGPLAESVQTDAAVVDTMTAEVLPVVEPLSKSVPFTVASRQTLLSEAEPVASIPVSEDRIPDTVRQMPDQVGHDEPVAHEDQVGHDVPVGETFPEIAPAPERKRFSIGVSGNGGQSSEERMHGYGMNNTAEYLTRTTAGNGQKDVNNVVRMLSANRASSFEAHHAAPLRAGVTASLELTPHLSLVSGVNWTYLNSEFEESAGPVRTVTGQDLGYLGVPLRLEASAHVWKGLWIHAGAGGMVEKGLMGKSWTDTFVDGRLAESKENATPDMGGLLCSVGAVAGAEYRFSPHFGLYFSPGIEYHFDNGSEVRSAYTEKPLHWNVNLGARFHFGE